MIRLLRAELARVRARPAVWGAVGLVLLGTLGLVVSAWWATRAPTAAQLAHAEEVYRSAALAWQETGEDQVRTCLDAQRGLVPGDPGHVDCTRLEPVREQYLPARPGGYALLDGRVDTVGLLAGIAAFLAATTLVCAEFASGAVGTWLTFAPRRGRVFVTRMAAAGLAALPIALAGFVALVVAVLLIGHLRGGAESVPWASWADLAGRVARWHAVVVGAALLGAGLGFVVRHSGAVTGLAVWWVAAVESALRIVLPSAGWLPMSVNVTAVLRGEGTYVVPSCVADPRAPGGEVCERVLHTVGAGQGVLVSGALVVLVVVAGWASFRLRDVS